jgi:predicted DNA-binding transcriptional regulator AlpA
MMLPVMRNRNILIRAVQEFFEPDVLRLSMAAQRIGISENELRKLINRGEGPEFVVIGRMTMIRQTSIDRWLAKKEAESRKVLKRNRDLVRQFDSPKPFKSQRRDA